MSNKDELKPFARLDPGTEFTERVMRGTTQMTAASRGARECNGWFKGSAVAALVAVIAGAAHVQLGQRERRLAGERAKQQVLAALSITSEQLQKVQEQLDRSTDDRQAKGEK